MASYNDVLKLSDVYLFQQSNTWPLTAVGTDITSIRVNGVVSNVSYTAVAGNSNVTANLTLVPPQFGVVHNIAKLGSASYYITANATGLANIAGSTSGTNLILNNLTKGNTYNFYAIATVGGANSLVGLGGTLSPVYTLSGLPSIGTPTYSNVNTGNTFMAVSIPITANADLGGGLVTYYAISSPEGIIGSSSNSIITVNGLSRGNTYTFTVLANNIVGNTAPTVASPSVTPAQVPGTPSICSANLSGLSTVVTYTAPADNGGATITSYTATSNPCSITSTLNQSGSGTFTFNNLIDGANYTFSVIATNTTGTSANSLSSNAVTTINSGTLYSWGYNAYGALGLSVGTAYYSSPKQVGALTNWRTGVGRYERAPGPNANGVFLTKTDGTLWGWGYGGAGMLGLGNTTNYSSPKQIGLLTNWKYATIGGPQTSMGVKTDGTAWSWGSNQGGVLGQNLSSLTYYYSPKQIGALTNWKIVKINRGVMAIKTDGSLWAWGINDASYGMLGLNNTTYAFSSPQQVGSLTNWLSISSASNAFFAIKTDGTLWSWGANAYGGLGLGNTTKYSSPKQVGALTNWLLTAASYQNCLAIKTDGTFWSWGYNGSGFLGLGNTTNYSSPKQVGALTNWKKIQAGNNHTMAIKTNGTLWAWGSNTRGQLGLGNRTAYSSPKQVGALTTWLDVIVSIGDGSYGILV